MDFFQQISGWNSLAIPERWLINLWKIFEIIREGIPGKIPEEIHEKYSGETSKRISERVFKSFSETFFFKFYESFWKNFWTHFFAEFSKGVLGFFAGIHENTSSEILGRTLKDISQGIPGGTFKGFLKYCHDSRGKFLKKFLKAFEKEFLKKLF